MQTIRRISLGNNKFVHFCKDPDCVIVEDGPESQVVVQSQGTKVRAVKDSLVLEWFDPTNLTDEQIINKVKDQMFTPIKHLN